MNNKTIRLQHVGIVPANYAYEIKIGSRIMFNYAEVEKVIRINKETTKSIWITLQTETGFRDKKYLKKSLVCILNK